MKPLRLCVLSLASLLILSTPARAQEAETLQFAIQHPEDSCRINYGRTDGLALSYAVYRGGILVTGVLADRWDIVDGKDLKADNHTLTIDYGDAGKAVSTKGGYINAKVQGIYALWEPGQTGQGGADDALAKLRRGRLVKVYFDDQYIGQFDMKQSGFAYMQLMDCMNNMAP